MTPFLAQTTAPAPADSTTTAQTTAPGTAATKAPPPPESFQLIRQMGPIILMVIVLFFLMNRSKKKTDKERTDMLAKLKKGDEIQTIGGILGKVMEAREDRVLVKVDENSNTKIWFGRSAIHKVVGTETETK
jgi:preprotein translocase subunit YajC